MKKTFRQIWEKAKAFLKKWLMFFLNPKLLLCFGIGWFITNGWSYAMFGIGSYYQIPWMIAVSGAYLTFLWFPFTPEKIVTVIIAIFLMKRIFPNDKKTLEVLRNELQEAKNDFRRFRAKMKEKREKRRVEKAERLANQKRRE